MGNVFEVDIDAAVREFADMVYRITVVNTNSEADAEDAFQETFVRLVRYKDKILTKEHLKAWLIRVATNECRRITGSAWKKNVSLAGSSDDDEEGDVLTNLAVYDEGGGMGNALSKKESASDSTLEVVISNETKDTVIDAVKTLPEKYREVIHLFYFEDFKVQDIASLLETNESTVKTRLKRAREALSLMLKGGMDL